jgi:hypothetical protein
MMRSLFISVRSEIIFDHLSILHDKPDALELGYVRDWIYRNSDGIREFPRLNRTYAIQASRARLPIAVPIWWRHASTAGGLQKFQVARDRADCPQVSAAVPRPKQ